MDDWKKWWPKKKVSKSKLFQNLSRIHVNFKNFVGSLIEGENFKKRKWSNSSFTAKLMLGSNSSFAAKLMLGYVLASHWQYNVKLAASFAFRADARLLASHWLVENRFSEFVICFKWVLDDLISKSNQEYKNLEVHIMIRYLIRIINE